MNQIVLGIYYWAPFMYNVTIQLTTANISHIANGQWGGRGAQPARKFLKIIGGVNRTPVFLIT